MTAAVWRQGLAVSQHTAGTKATVFFAHRTCDRAAFGGCIEGLANFCGVSVVVGVV